jgi:hypothetical protein
MAMLGWNIADVEAAVKQVAVGRCFNRLSWRRSSQGERKYVVNAAGLVQGITLVTFAAAKSLVGRHLPVHAEVRRAPEDRRRGGLDVHRIDQPTEQMIRSVLAYAENRLRMDPVRWTREP